MTWYVFKKLRGNVVFFNSHNLYSGLFQKNLITWIKKGRLRRPMRVIQRYKDNRYGFSLKEWVTLVIPLSGETMQEISTCTGIPVHTLYQTRQNALKKIGIKSYRHFSELFISGEIHTENSNAR